MLIREVSDGTDLDQVLLVREVDKRVKRDGGEFLRLTLGDRSGQEVAMVWDDVEDVVPLVAAGQPVRVSGRYVVHPRYGPQLNLRAVSPAEPGTYEPGDLLDGPLRNVHQMESDLRELIATVRQPHLHELLERLL